MLPHRFPRPVRVGLYALAAAILFLLCVLPTEDLPDTGTSDRFDHAAAWFVLTVTGYVLAPERRIAIPVFALAFGVLVEVAQGLMGLGRHTDALDLVADSLGVALGVAAYFATRRFVRLA